MLCYNLLELSEHWSSPYEVAVREEMKSECLKKSLPFSIFEMYNFMVYKYRIYLPIKGIAITTRHSFIYVGNSLDGKTCVWRIEGRHL